MYSNCSGISITYIDEIQDLINRFYRKAGRDAEANGAESMLPYIEQRDKRNEELENHNRSQYEEISILRKKEEEAKGKADSNYRSYMKQIEETRIEKDRARLLKKLLEDVSKTPGFKKSIPRTLRGSIMKAII